MKKNDKKLLAASAVERLKEIYPEAVCALEWGGEDGWKLLVMGRLSAQCTDARVNIVCKELFAKTVFLLDGSGGTKGNVVVSALHDTR